MSDHPEHDRLEQAIDRALRDLPPRRAPRHLETRILGELQRRAAFPWWRRGFAQWPWLARSTLIVVCVALTGVTLLDGPWSALVTAGGLATLIVHVVPPGWLDLVLAVAGMFYVLLFGLSAAAYRTLYLQPSNGR